MDHLQLKDLSFLENGPYNLSLKANNCCCISGPSGIGKSKLFRCISDLDLYSGTVLYNETSSQDIQPSLWRKTIGYLPAESRWWYEDVGSHFHHYDNLIFDQLGFDEEIMQWSIDRLSTGEKQRLAIIRLLLNTPKVLLLDEPTASLDKSNVLRVEKMITEIKINQEMIVLWISHDSEQIHRIADIHFQLEKTQLTPVELN